MRHASVLTSLLLACAAVACGVAGQDDAVDGQDPLSVRSPTHHADASPPAHDAGAADAATTDGGTADASAADASTSEDGLMLPIPSLTPGAVLTTDLQKICQPGYPSTVRNVSAQEKAAVAAAYGYTGPSSGVEYDHLISLELGGSNDQTNLWPEPIAEAKVKDRLEGYLHTQVCHGGMQLADVQARIAADWVKLWNEVGRP
jgi:hypothetical protein